MNVIHIHRIIQNEERMKYVVHQIFNDLTVSGKSYILVFNLLFIAESGLVKYSAGDYVSIFRSFRPNPPNNEQVTL